MTQIGLDSHTLGVPADDGHCADVSGPRPGYAIPAMMRSKFIGQAAAKIVRLSDIYRIPKPVGSKFAENIDSADFVERNLPKFEVIKFVGRPAGSGPRKARFRVD
jgi:hypothetical protein